MPQPNKIPLAFAASGDKNTIPERTETTGLASWRDGFPAITSAPFSEGGIAPKRADFNGIFNALSQAVMWLQQGGVYAYDVNTDYEAGNVVLDAGGLYVANAANGPSSTVVQPSSDTTGATWKPLRLDLATQSAAGYMSSNDKTLVDSIPELGTFNRMFFSQISGSYTAPRTGVYRITLKGGGGGGGGAQTTTGRSGAGGGEGAQNIFYVNMTKKATYNYVVGAGGSAGVSGENYVDISSGSDGGNSMITIAGTTHTALGGSGGRNSQTGLRGGLGGGLSNTAGIVIPGANGDSGCYGQEYVYNRPKGGGNRGAYGDDAALYGGGGGGANSTIAASDGAKGYILIEYAG